MLLQKEEEKLRAAIRLEGTRKRAKEKNMARGLSGNYLEDEEEEEEGSFSISAIKKGYKKSKGEVRGNLSGYI